MNFKELSTKEIKDLMPIYKPGKWTEGNTLRVLTNHWLMTIHLPEALFRYEVTVTAERLGAPPPPSEEKPSPSKEKPKQKGGKPKGKQPSGDGGGDPGQPAQQRQPPKINKDILKKIIALITHRLRAELPREHGLITDYSRLLISTVPLFRPGSDMMSLDCDIQHRELPNEDDANMVYHVSIVLAEFGVDLNSVRGVINTRDFLKNPDLTEMKQIYNILMKNTGGYEGEWFVSGRSSLLRMAGPNDNNYLGYSMMNWKGASLICTVGATWKPFLNVEVSNCAMLIKQNVLEAIAEILIDPRAFRDSTFERREETANYAKAEDVTGWRPRDYETVMEILKSCKVRRDVKNRQTNRMEKRDSRLDGICGFGADSQGKRLAGEIIFDFEGRRISVQQYFESVLGMRLQYPRAPVLILGKAKVPAEFCVIKEGQSINRLLPSNPQQRMLTQCTEKPHEKSTKINNYVSKL